MYLEHCSECNHLSVAGNNQCLNCGVEFVYTYNTRSTYGLIVLWLLFASAWVWVCFNVVKLN